MINVEKITENKFKISVKSRIETTHEVTLADSFYQKLTGGVISREALIHKSFMFLLERESNTSILRSFDLSLISTYFPEYENIIRE